MQQTSHIKIGVFDGVTPLLQEIQIRSREMALEALSVAGSKVQKEARAAMATKRTPWTHGISESTGRRRIYKDGSNPVGRRRSHSTGDILDPKSMSSMLTSYLMDKKLTVVIGG